jgi:hypothetical protein
VLGFRRSGGGTGRLRRVARGVTHGSAPTSKRELLHRNKGGGYNTAAGGGKLKLPGNRSDGKTIREPAK